MVQSFILFIYVYIYTRRLQNHCRWWLQPWNQKTLASWQESYDKPRQCVEKQGRYSADKCPYSQGYGFPSGHVQLWELDYKEGRMPKNWCLWTVVLEKTPESPLESKEIKAVNQGRSILNIHWKDWCWSFSILVIWCNEHELGQTLGDGEGQGGLVCCSLWDLKESDTTRWLNNNNNNNA